MKRRKRNNTEFELGGQDSFLDLVSNIVGILIILVMVAGVRAQFSSANDSEPPADSQMIGDLEAKYEELQTKEGRTAQLREDFETLQVQSEIIAEQINRQGMEYAALFDLLASVRSEMELAAEEKCQSFKEKIEYQRQLLETKAKLEQIDREKTHLRQTRPQATRMENIPTPLSKMVGDDKEIHVRLLGGRIVYVPFMELIAQLRRNVGDDQNRYFRQQTSVGKVGPIENFELEFLLVTHNYPAPRIDFQYGEVTPVFEPLGQPLREALVSPQSEFRRKLSTFRRDIYTVTVWVYPDSFEEYQELKRFLHDLGYSVAARPMSMGDPISASPYGTKSSTQ